MKMLSKTLFLFIVGLASVCEAKPRLATVFGDHQVLQRDMPVPLWGVAEPGESVTVTFAGQRKVAVAQKDGRWFVTLDPMPASAEPRTLILKSPGSNLELSDLLVGDVWLCAGPGGGFQRETTRLFKIAGSEMAKANHPQVRLLKPVLGTSVMPVEEIDAAGRWTAVAPKTIGAFPISWYLARELNAATGVPVGFIQVHSEIGRPSEWQAWRFDAKNTRQAQIRAAAAKYLPQDIIAAEAWIQEAKSWKPGRTFDKQFPLPTYLVPNKDDHPELANVTHSAYNTNVTPFAGMGLRGVIFLCEFANCSIRTEDVGNLVSSWRQAWNRPELPFFLVSPIERQPNSPRVNEALALAANLPMVKVIPRPADANPMALNPTLWKSVAALAREVPVQAGSDIAIARNWAAPGLRPPAKAQKSLEAACLFGENMVVQSGMKVPVWGWGEPGAAVTVSFAGQQVKGAVQEDGAWRVELAPLQVSRTPLEMTVASSHAGQVETLKFGNAVVGEVWGNSGQSNAGRVMSATLGFAEEQPKANWPEIRCIRIDPASSGFPLRRARGKWLVVTPETIGGMPAQAYYFAKQIHQRLKTPFGIVNSSLTGSSIYAWIDEGALSASPKFQPLLADAVKYREARTANLPFLQQWLRVWIEGAGRNPSVARPMPYYPVNAMLSTAMEARAGIHYNAMIYPIIGTALRGFLWNQGEADTGGGARGDFYAELMAAMVASWRKSWGYEFPFYFVQLPARKTGGLPQMWAKQTAAMNAIPNCGMIVCNDIADGDVHPVDKKNVGKRLARLALVRTYGARDIIDSSPFMKSVKRDGSRVVVAFAPAGDGLKTRDGKASDSWELAGADGKFVFAQAVIAGDRVLVSAAEIAQPTAIQLGWRDVSNCNLINSAGLPAMPFTANVKD